MNREWIDNADAYEAQIHGRIRDLLIRSTSISILIGHCAEDLVHGGEAHSPIDISELTGNQFGVEHLLEELLEIQADFTLEAMGYADALHDAAYRREQAEKSREASPSDKPKQDARASKKGGYRTKAERTEALQVIINEILHASDDVIQSVHSLVNPSPQPAG